MKLVLKLSMFLLAFFSFSNETFSLTDYQIKNLQEKRSDLQKGKFIEIPVKPYKSW